MKWSIVINDDNTPIIRYYQINKERGGGGGNLKDYNDITSFFHTYNEQLSFHPNMLDWDYTKIVYKKHRLTQKKKREKNGK